MGTSSAKCNNIKKNRIEYNLRILQIVLVSKYIPESIRVFLLVSQLPLCKIKFLPNLFQVISTFISTSISKNKYLRNVVLLP